MRTLPWWPKVYRRLSTHGLAAGLTRRPDGKVSALVWGPFSILWDSAFKQAEAERRG